MCRDSTGLICRQVLWLILTEKPCHSNSLVINSKPTCKYKNNLHHIYTLNNEAEDGILVFKCLFTFVCHL